jgi:sporulation protein YlmC with PRC-barrel domain
MKYRDSSASKDRYFCVFRVFRGRSPWCAIFAGALFAGFPADAPAQSRRAGPESAAAMSELNGTLRVASKRDAETTVHAFAGRRVDNTKGEKLGTIQDRAIDAHSGRVAYAIVSPDEESATLRPVPFAALQNPTGADVLTVEIERAQWEQLSPFSADDFAREHDIARAGTRFLVPLRQLNRGATDLDSIQTTLTRADFQTAESIGQSGAVR